MVRRYSNAVSWTDRPGERSSISILSAPTDADRAVMAGRRRDLADALVPADADAIGLMISSIRSVMPSHDSSDPVQQVALYRSALSRFPEWAVGQVCRAFLEGRAGGSTTFAPTPADIAKRCADLIAPHQQEVAQIGRILDAEIIPEPESDEKRAEVAERVRQWVRDRQQTTAAVSKMTDDELAAWAIGFRERCRTETAPLSALAKNTKSLIEVTAKRRKKPDMDGREEAPEHAEVRS